MQIYEFFKVGVLNGLANQGYVNKNETVGRVYSLPTVAGINGY